MTTGEASGTWDCAAGRLLTQGSGCCGWGAPILSRLLVAQASIVIGRTHAPQGAKLRRLDKKEEQMSSLRRLV